MKVLLYLLLPVLVVAATAVGMWARNRQPSSLESGVAAFRREMDALSPDAAPVQRRRPMAEPAEFEPIEQDQAPPPRRRPSPEPDGPPPPRASTPPRPAPRRPGTAPGSGEP